MKNIVNNSTISAVNGIVSIGDTFIDLNSSSNYVTIDSEIKKKKAEKSALRSKIQDLENDSKKDENSYKDQFFEHLSRRLVEIEDEINKLFRDQNEIIKSLVSVFNITENKSLIFSGIEQVKECLRKNELDSIDQYIDGDNLIEQSDLLFSISQSANIRQIEISYALLVKARMLFLNTEVKNPLEKVNFYFLKSINAAKTVENLTDYAEFLAKYKAEESGKYYLMLLENFTDEFFDEELGDIHGKIAYSYTHQRKFSEVIKSNQLAINKYIQAQNKLVADPKLLLKQAVNLRSMATSFMLSPETLDLAETKLQEAGEIFSVLKDLREDYLEKYSEYIAVRVQLSLIKGIFDNTVRSYVGNYIEIQEIIYKDNSDNKNKNISSMLALLADFQIRVGDNNSAYLNLKEAESLLMETDLYNYETVSSLGVINSKLSHVYENINDLSRAERCMKNAISYFKMRKNINPYEARELTANFLIELSELHKKRNVDPNNYLNSKFEALILFEEQFKLEPTRDINSVLGTFQKLGITYLNNSLEEKTEQYYYKLKTFLDFCEGHHPENRDLAFIIIDIEKSYGLFHEIIKKDLNKAKDIYINILSKIESRGYVKDLKVVTSFIVSRLIENGIHSVEINGKKAMIGFQSQSEK